MFISKVQLYFYTLKAQTPSSPHRGRPCHSCRPCPWCPGPPPPSGRRSRPSWCIPCPVRRSQPGPHLPSSSTDSPPSCRSGVRSWTGQRLYSLVAPTLLLPVLTLGRRTVLGHTLPSLALLGLLTGAGLHLPVLHLEVAGAAGADLALLLGARGALADLLEVGAGTGPGAGPVLGLALLGTLLTRGDDQERSLA